MHSSERSLTHVYHAPGRFTATLTVTGTLFVGANGLIGFASSGLASAANIDLPNAAAPNALIASYWADLNPAQDGSVRTGTSGAAPNRRFVISSRPTTPPV